MTPPSAFCPPMSGANKPASERPFRRAPSGIGRVASHASRRAAVPRGASLAAAHSTCTHAVVRLRGGASNASDSIKYDLIECPEREILANFVTVSETSAGRSPTSTTSRIRVLRHGVFLLPFLTHDPFFSRFRGAGNRPDIRLSSCPRMAPGPRAARAPFKAVHRRRAGYPETQTCCHDGRA